MGRAVIMHIDDAPWIRGGPRGDAHHLFEEALLPVDHRLEGGLGLGLTRQPGPVGLGGLLLQRLQRPQLLLRALLYRVTTTIVASRGAAPLDGYRSTVDLALHLALEGSR